VIVFSVLESVLDGDGVLTEGLEVAAAALTAMTGAFTSGFFGFGSLVGFGRRSFCPIRSLEVFERSLAMRIWERFSTPYFAAITERVSHFLTIYSTHLIVGMRIF